MNETMLTIASDLRSESLTKNLTRNEVVVLFARGGANSDEAKKPLRGLYRAVRGGLPSDVFSQADIARLLSALRIGGRQGVAVAFDPTVEHPWSAKGSNADGQSRWASTGSNIGKQVNELRSEIKSADYMVDRFVVADALSYLAFSAFSETPDDPDNTRTKDLVREILDGEDREAYESLREFAHQHHLRDRASGKAASVGGTVPDDFFGSLTIEASGLGRLGRGFFTDWLAPSQSDF